MSYINAQLCALDQRFFQMPQLGLLYLLIYMPMNMLSGSNNPAGKHARWLATVMEASPSTHFRIPCRRSSPRRTIFLSPILSFSGRRLAASMESKDPARSAILRARFSWLRPRGLRPSIPLPACGSSHRNLLHEAVVLPERAGAAPRAREHSKRGLTRLSIAPKRASDSLAWPRPVTPSRSL